MRKQNERYEFRMTHEERLKLENLAIEKGKTMAEMIRTWIQNE